MLNSQFKVLVTGANGLLGANTILDLLEQGFLVRGFIRTLNSRTALKHPNLEYAFGDIMHAESIKKAMKGCQYVIHIAALTDPKISDYQTFEKVNVIGTKNVIKMAREFEILKFVYVSTANVFGYGSKNDLGNERKEMQSPFNKMAYAKSKQLGQQFVLSQSDAMDITVVNPTFMIGPYDSKPSSGRIILNCLNKQFVFCPPGGKNFVCVKDVSGGIVNALRFGKRGEAYLLCNENLSFFEFYKKVRLHSKQAFVIIKLPRWVILGMGYFGNIARFIGIETAISISNTRAVCINNFYDNRKAREELRLSFNPIDTGIKEAIDWFEKSNSKNKPI